MRPTRLQLRTGVTAKQSSRVCSSCPQVLMMMGLVKWGWTIRRDVCNIGLGDNKTSRKTRCLVTVSDHTTLHCSDRSPQPSQAG